MSSQKRIIISLKKLRSHVEDYWFAIPSMVKNINDLKTILTTEENLNAEEVDLYINDVLLRNNSCVDIIKDEDIVEIRTKCCGNITNVKKFSMKKLSKRQSTVNDIVGHNTDNSDDNNCVVNVNGKRVKQEPIVNSLDNSVVNKRIKREPIDNNDKTVIKQEIPIESIVQIHDNHNNIVNGCTSSQTNEYMFATNDNQLLFTTSSSSSSDNQSKQQTTKNSCRRCDYKNCNKLFKNQFDLQQHIKAKHEMVLRPFKCPHKGCGSGFRLRNQLEKHIQTKHLHTGAQCTNRFISERLSIDWLKLDQTTNRFNCDYYGCNKGNLTKSKFIKHLRYIHYNCCYDNCPQSCRSMKDLVKHMRNVHNIEWLPYKCFRSNCKQQFQTLSEFMKHKWIAHRLINN
ncbi:uncharacterized protein LOC128963188 [Oppia nitens]|uniref:uncharacterized protein LOC128963188 n=1 Tax=Oppia nitens TaxID=1686743 RepID=UPI0023DA5FAD|nr:uncharacterized protein LOC128963188 [Oppia nitens]